MLTLALGSLTGKSGERDGGRQEVGDKKGVEKKMSMIKHHKEKHYEFY